MSARPPSAPAPPPPPSPSARILRYMLWASELALVLAFLYALAHRPPRAPGAGASPPAAATSPPPGASPGRP
jgi:hypothetical protein